MQLEKVANPRPVGFYYSWTRSYMTPQIVASHPLGLFTYFHPIGSYIYFHPL